MTDLSALHPHYDVVIAGGGMVGASLALSLSQHSQGELQILLIESFPLKTQPGQPVYTPSFDARSTALSYGSRLIYESLGVWPTLAQHCSPITQIHVSSRGAFGSTVMTAAEMQWPALGYVVENAWLGNSLMAALAEQGSVTLAAPATVKTLHNTEQSCSLTLQQDAQSRDIEASLVVVADGADSGLRTQLGIEHQTTTYEQVSLVANVCFSQPHAGCAYERFTASGPVALLPLSNSEQNQPRAALVWSLPPEQAELMSGCDEATFLAQLQQQFGHRVGEFTKVGQRSSYPLRLIEAKEQVRQRIVIMGNAAHSLHPVAGQGFNLALRDCASLTHIVCSGLREGGAIGSLTRLNQYLQAQHSDQQTITHFSHHLPSLFTAKQWPLAIARQLGLGVLDVTPAVKKAFVQQTSGMFPGAAGAQQQ